MCVFVWLCACECVVAVVCGYIAVASALALADGSPVRGLRVCAPPDGDCVSPADIDALLRPLRDQGAMVEAVRAAVAVVAASRGAWIAAHPSDFAAPRAAAACLSAWVANFEVSDLLAGARARGRAGRVCFARAVERGAVSHEEAIRVREEAEFAHCAMFVEAPRGGAGGGGDDSGMHDRTGGGAGGGGGDNRLLLTPSEWIATRRAGALDESEPAPVFVVDALSVRAHGDMHSRIWSCACPNARRAAALCRRTPAAPGARGRGLAAAASHARG